MTVIEQRQIGARQADLGVCPPLRRRRFGDAARGSNGDAGWPRRRVHEHRRGTRGGASSTCDPARPCQCWNDFVGIRKLMYRVSTSRYSAE